MWRSKVLAIVILVLASCSSELPEHSEFISVKSRAELRSLFGEPLSIEAYESGPDVLSIKELASGNIPVFQIERWVCESTRATNLADSRVLQEPGKTLFSFGINKEDSGDVIQNLNWLNDADFARVQNMKVELPCYQCGPPKLDSTKQIDSNQSH